MTSHTPEELRVAVCEALGWRLAGHPDHSKATNGWKFGRHFAIEPGNKLVSRNSLPPLTLDLMALAEATLSDDDHTDFRLLLDEIAEEVWQTHPQRRDYDRIRDSLNAEQRARAFVAVKQV